MGDSNNEIGNLNKEMMFLNPFKGGLRNKIKKEKEKEKELKQCIFEPFKNKHNESIITKYLMNEVHESDFKAILIRGSIGCGKMNLIKYIIQNTQKKIFVYDLESDNTFNNLMLSIKSKGLFNERKVIVIHDLENSLKSTDKSTLFNFLTKINKMNHLIITSTDNRVGSVREIPKVIKQLEYEYPSITELTEHFYNGTISRNALKKLIISSNFDLRSILNGVSGIKTKTSINKILEYSKDLELDTFSCIDYCTDESKTIEQKLVYSSLYTNNTVFHNYPNMTDDYYTVADSCSVAETFVNYSFENQCLHTFYEYSLIFGTIDPLSRLRMTELTYPSSNLTVFNEEKFDFKILENESMMINIIVSKYFKANKFNNRFEEFAKELSGFKYPLHAYRLANINGKQSANIKKELRKLVNTQ